MGRLKAIDRVDGSFFGNTKLMGDSIDPQSRILLETTYEAIIDAGNLYQVSVFALKKLKLY